MPKNGYFEVTYKILDYLYACFQAGEKPDLTCYSAEALGINRGYWRNVISALSDEGYVKGAEAVTGSADSTPTERIARFLHTKITQKGIIFLLENELIAKVRKSLNDSKKS